MANRRGFTLLLTLSLLAHAFSVPVEVLRLRRGFGDNEVDSKEHGARFDLVAASSDVRKVRQSDGATATEKDSTKSEDEPSKLHLSPLTTTTAKAELASPLPLSNDDDDEDDDFEPMNTSPTTGGGGSNIFSLLRLAGALFPGSSSANDLIRTLLREFLYHNQGPIPLFMRRSDVVDNEIDIDYDTSKLKPPFLQRQETKETESESESESESGSESESLQDTEEDIDNAAEESVEKNGNGNKNNEDEKKSNQESASNADNSDYDDDEPPGGGDGQGGGVLGLLAGLSGGEDGQSDLGSLLAAVSGIVINLSGDGVDLNAIIASGLGLFVGLLSEGNENPGAVIAQYLLTSLETITGGGSKNNGAFFGNLLSTLIKGTSAGMNPDASSEENKPPMKDSVGFFASLLMGLLGDMSKGSSGSSSQPWERSLEMIR